MRSPFVPLDREEQIEQNKQHLRAADWALIERAIASEGRVKAEALGAALTFMSSTEVDRLRKQEWMNEALETVAAERGLALKRVRNTLYLVPSP